MKPIRIALLCLTLSLATFRIARAEAPAVTGDNLQAAPPAAAAPAEPAPGAAPASPPPQPETLPAEPQPGSADAVNPWNPWAAPAKNHGKKEKEENPLPKLKEFKADVGRTSEWSLFRQGAVASVFGGGAVGDRTNLQGFFGVDVGISAGVAELSFDLGAGDAAGNISGLFFYGVGLRAYPLGRTVVGGVHISPYATGTARYGYEFSHDDLFDTSCTGCPSESRDRERIGVLDAGIGIEIGLAKQDRDFNLFIEGYNIWTNSGGRDMPSKWKGWTEDAEIMAGIRWRTLDD